MTMTDKNENLFLRAQKTTPGGVNSPVRAFRSVGGTPRFIQRAEGPYFWDAEDRQDHHGVIGRGPRRQTPPSPHWTQA